MKKKTRTHPRGRSIWNDLFFWIFTVGVGSVMLVFYPHIFAQSAHFKQLLLLVCVALVSAYVLVKNVTHTCVLTAPQRVVFFSVLSVLVASFITMLGANSSSAWWGSATFFGGSASVIFLLAAAHYTFTRIVHTKKQWQIFVVVLCVAVAISVSVTVVAALFKNNVVAQVLGPSFSTLDVDLASLGVWASVLLLGALGFFVRKNISWQWRCVSAMGVVLALVLAVLLHYSTVLNLTVAACVLLGALGFIFNKEVEQKALAAPFVVAVILVAIRIFGVPLLEQNIFLPQPILSQRASWTIVAQSLSASSQAFIFGSGFGSFANNFLLYRPAAFNADPQGWNLRFFAPASTQQEIINDGGALLWVTLLFWAAFTTLVLARVMLQAFRLGKKNFAGEALAYASVGTVWLFVEFISFSVHFGFALWVLWWLLGALVVVWPRLTQPEEIVEQSRAKRGWFVLGRGIFSASLIVLFIFETNNFVGVHNFNKGKASSNPRQSAVYFEKAVARSKNNGVYLSALAEAYALQARGMSGASSTTAQAVSLLAKAIATTAQATQADPRNAFVWVNASELYAQVSEVFLEARVKALFAGLQAQKLDPTNALVTLRLGDMYVALAHNTSTARNYYMRALELKNDWPQPYARLAELELINNNTSAALAWLGRGLPTAGNDQKYLFRYGFLVYTYDTKRDDAFIEELWARALQLQPDFVEPAFGLAELYSQQKKYVLAARYYKKVLEAQPKNTAVLERLKAVEKNI